MKFIAKSTILASFLALMSGCTGTSYNADKSCGTDYLLHPVISIPKAIGACE